MLRRLLLPALALLLLVLPATAFAVHYGDRTLRKGRSGSDVRALQRYLGEVGITTTVDGQFGPRTAASVRQWESSEGLPVNGVVTPSDADALRESASEVDTTEAPETPPTVPTEEATLTEDGLAVAPSSAPPEVKAVIAAGNKIASKPYKYGGGHGRWRDSGYDCSGSMSYVLHAAGLLDTPLDSSGFTTYGERGRGTWITTYGNSGHSYMLVAGLRFDTSARRLTGTRWTDEMRSPRGYKRRHPTGF